MRQRVASTDTWRAPAFGLMSEVGEAERCRRDRVDDAPSPAAELVVLIGEDQAYGDMYGDPIGTGENGDADDGEVISAGGDRATDAPTPEGEGAGPSGTGGDGVGDRGRAGGREAADADGVASAAGDGGRSIGVRALSPILTRYTVPSGSCGVHSRTSSPGGNVIPSASFSTMRAGDATSNCRLDNASREANVVAPGRRSVADSEPYCTLRANESSDAISEVRCDLKAK